jgi:hypothetical protein
VGPGRQALPYLPSRVARAPLEWPPAVTASTAPLPPSNLQSISSEADPHFPPSIQQFLPLNPLLIRNQGQWPLMAIAARTLLPLPSRPYLSPTRAPATPPLHALELPHLLTLAHTPSPLRNPGRRATAGCPRSSLSVKCSGPSHLVSSSHPMLNRTSIQITGSSSTSLKRRRRHLQASVATVDLHRLCLPIAQTSINSPPCGEQADPHLLFFYPEL